MKNKKILIISILAIILVAIVCGIYFVRTNYLFNEDGTITDGHKDLITTLEKVEDKEERKKQVDTALENNLITEKETNELY